LGGVSNQAGTTTTIAHSAAAAAALSNLGSSLGLSANAALFNRRQQLLQQAAALQSQANAIDQETALLNAALGFQHQQGTRFFGGLPF